MEDIFSDSFLIKNRLKDKLDVVFGGGTITAYTQAKGKGLAEKGLQTFWSGKYVSIKVYSVSLEVSNRMSVFLCTFLQVQKIRKVRPRCGQWGLNPVTAPYFGQPGVPRWPRARQIQGY